MEEKSKLSGLKTDVWATFVSRSRPPLALILSDDPFTDLGKLTLRRCQAALPFAGKYRVIDFALSNCINSEIESVGVITQYQPRSLHAHLAYGRPWGLDRRERGLALLHPYQGRTSIGWYTGTADAVFQNQEFIFRNRTDEVLVLAGCEVSCLDLSVLVAQHRKAKADLTIAVAAIKGETASRHHTLTVDYESWVRALIPPGTSGPGPLAVMGVLLFSTDTLSWRLSEDSQQPSSTHDLIRDVIPRMIQEGDRVMAFRHTGYWNGLQTVHDYWRANMDLLGENPDLNLQDAAWPIRTRPEVRPPTRFSRGARVSHSLLSEGCIVDGTVEYSILSPGVFVAPGAVVRNAVVMHDSTIEERAIVENAIVDMQVIIGPQARIGQARRHAPTVSASTPDRLTIVEQRARIPGNEVIRPHPASDDWVLSAQRTNVPNERISAL